MLPTDPIERFARLHDMNIGRPQAAQRRFCWPRLNRQCLVRRCERSLHIGFGFAFQQRRFLHGLGFFLHAGHLFLRGLHLRREFPIPGFILHQFIFAPLHFTIELAGPLLFLGQKALEIQAACLFRIVFLCHDTSAQQQPSTDDGDDSIAGSWHQLVHAIPPFHGYLLLLRS